MAATDASGRLLATSVASASSLMALQLFSRCFTFALNQALFRLASPATFGAAAIQFELILSTILFLSREGVRNALLRVTDTKTTHPNAKAKSTNLSFLPVLMGVPLSLVTSLVYVILASDEIRMQPYFHSVITIYALAAVFELLSEPLYNYAMIELKTSVRVRAEGLGITGKSVVTLLLLFYDARSGDGSLALIAFAAGQMAYSFVVFLVYISFFGGEPMKFKTTSIAGKNTGYFDQELRRLSFTMTSQSLIKHFLTEGDKLVLSWFSPLHDQGGYALAVNYGSLIARIVFQPIEETLRLFFSKNLSGGSTPEDGSDESKQSLKLAASTLQSLLSVQVAFSLILVVFGSAYLPLVLPMVLPVQYLATSAPRVLAAWIWYIPVLALNGGLEAFLSSVATPSDLNRQSRWMVSFSILYVSSAIFLYRMGIGDASLVYANIFNLTTRIVYCLHFISDFFSKAGCPQLFSWQAARPSWKLVLSAVLSALSIAWNQRRYPVVDIASNLGNRALLDPHVLFHIGLGGTLAVACLITWWLTSGRHLNLPLRNKKVE